MLKLRLLSLFFLAVLFCACVEETASSINLTPEIESEETTTPTEVPATAFAAAYTVDLPVRTGLGEHQLILTAQPVHEGNELTGTGETIVIEYSGAEELVTGEYDLNGFQYPNQGSYINKVRLFSSLDFAENQRERLSFSDGKLTVDRNNAGELRVTFTGRVWESWSEDIVYHVNFVGTPQQITLEEMEPLAGTSQISGESAVAYGTQSQALRTSYLRPWSRSGDSEKYQYDLLLAVEDAAINGQLVGTTDVVLVRFTTAGPLADGRYRKSNREGSYLDVYRAMDNDFAFCSDMDFATGLMRDDDMGSGETIIEIDGDEVAVSVTISNNSGKSTAAVYRGNFQLID
ncbi:MAG: hypothetical protein AAFZ52_05435 [Bacteroidota bacterium]